MRVLHAFWAPHPPGQVRRAGFFYIWVESLEALGKAQRGRHPRALAADALAALLGGMKLDGSARHMNDVALLLPTVGGTPLPGPELAQSAPGDAADELPDASLQLWTISAWPVRTRPIAVLNELHFQSLLQSGGLRAGGDFLFWYWFTQSLKALLFREGYVPALRVVKGNAYACWEFATPDYEALISRAAESFAPAAGPGYAAESLLRHCAEVLLHGCVDAARVTAALEKKISGTLVEAALATARGDNTRFLADEETRRSWLAWHRQIGAENQAAGFDLALQLHDAAASDPDRWHLEFRAIGRRDASLQCPLADYWTADADARAALRRSFGADFEQSVLLTLGQAARTYPKLWQALETDRPIGMDLTLEEAFGFLNETAWILQDAGLRVIVPAWFTPQGRRRAKLRLKSSGGGKKVAAAAKRSSLNLEELLSFRYELTLGDEPVAVEEWERLLESKIPLVQLRGQWVALDRERMQEMLDFWKQRGGEEQVLEPIDLLRQSAESGGLYEVDPGDALGQMLERLRDPHNLEPVNEPPGLNARLREYQKRGLAWIGLLEDLGLNGCLADDMGLGKTIQVIARLLAERAAESPGVPTLLVAPTSVLGNWRKEIERFAQELRVHLHHGGARTGGADEFAAACRDVDVVISSYGLVRRDAAVFAAVRWRRVVLDEAQNIKNPLAAQTQAVLKLQADRRLALTGTPVENRLLDLWSIFNFLNPGYLGKQAQFRKNFELPIQRENDPARSSLLRKLVEPFILRRVKTDPNIIKDLPAKVENRQFCELNREQASLYEALVRDVERELEEAEGIQRQGLMLSTLTKLKQICNHPAQFLQDESPFTPERSAKLERLLAMLGEVLAEGESALVFTQFTEIGSRLERVLRTGLDCQTYYLHGGTSRARREQMIERFQNPETPPAVFVLSLKAGGVGITLTRANHVFHFDRWWNPAVEDQATDRAFRIGQQRSVFVHKFVTLGTLEERIDRMIEDKRQVAGAIVGSDESWLAQLDNQSFKRLIALNRQTLTEDP